MELKAKKLANMMVDNVLSTFGIPTVVTSDQGPNFVGPWWRTVCARLGIRTAYSQAHRAQGNGRAEVAGKQIYNLLRKLHVEEKLNWVEALPRVFRIHNDTIGECGMSPYQILFGRDRNEAGIPYQPPKECENATHFMKIMSEYDKKVATFYQEILANQQALINAKRKEKSSFHEGDVVWVLRAQPPSGNKLESWWLGPAKVIQRVVDSSYKVLLKPGVIYDVHKDWLKPYVEDNFLGTGVPLFFHQGTTKSTGLGDTQSEDEQIEGVKKHRVRNGKLEFRVRWKGTSSQEDTWEPIGTFITKLSQPFLQYVQENGLENCLLDLNSSE